jgi:hypothetical protein
MGLNVIEDVRVRPFSCGSQGADWQASNCNRCKKRIPDDGDYTQFKCEIQKSLGDAYMTDGTVSAEIGRRMGYDRQFYGWQCPEVDWSAEWIAECKRRRTWAYRIRRFYFTRRRNILRWYDDRRQSFIQWWRWPEALKHCDEGTEGCWAEWAMWGMGYDKDRPLGSCASCRAEAEGDSQSCWCGKFCKKDENAEVAK